MRKRLFLFLLAQALALSVGQAAACPGQLTLIIADRVSSTVAEHRTIFLDGLGVTLRQSLVGPVELIQVREQGVGMQEVHKTCLLGLIDEKAEIDRLRQDSEKSTDWSQRFLNNTLGKSIDSNLEFAGKVAILKQRNKNEWSQKRAVSDAGKKISAAQQPPFGGYDLLSVISTLLRDRCGSEAKCKLLIFSSLVDVRSVNALAAEAQDIRKLGEDHGRYMVDNRKVNKLKISADIVVWGFGAADALGKPLSTSSLRRIEEFWGEAFAQVTSGSVKIMYKLQ